MVESRVRIWHYLQQNQPSNKISTWFRHLKVWINPESYYDVEYRLKLCCTISSTKYQPEIDVEIRSCACWECRLRHWVGGEIEWLTFNPGTRKVHQFYQYHHRHFLLRYDYGTYMYKRKFKFYFVMKLNDTHITN